MTIGWQPGGIRPIIQGRASASSKQGSKTSQVILSRELPTSDNLASTGGDEAAHHAFRSLT